MRRPEDRGVRLENIGPAPCWWHGRSDEAVSLETGFGSPAHMAAYLMLHAAMCLSFLGRRLGGLISTLAFYNQHISRSQEIRQYRESESATTLTHKPRWTLSPPSVLHPAS